MARGENFPINWRRRPKKRCVCVRVRGRNCKLTPVKHGTTYLRHGGAMARVHCHRGYTLHGPQFLACTNGHWNGTQPECLCQFAVYIGLIAETIGLTLRCHSID